MSVNCSVLIGKGRHITLEELWSVGCGEGHLDWHDPEQEFGDEMEDACACLSAASMEDGDCTAVEEGSRSRVVATVLALASAQTDDSLARRYMKCVEMNKVVVTSAEDHRFMYLAMAANASVTAYMLSKVVDALAAASIERLNWTMPDAEEQPHRGIASSTAILRSFLQSSKFIAHDTNNNNNNSIAHVHGPAKEVLHSSMKTIELELNVACANSYTAETVACLAFSSVLHAVQTLTRASNERTQTTPTSSSSSNVHHDSLKDVALALVQAVQVLQSSLQKEASLAMDFQITETEKAQKEAQQKEAEKAAKEAAYQKEQQSSTDGAGNNNDDEFAGMTEAQKAKILKKRAEKEAKKAAKKTKCYQDGKYLWTRNQIFGTSLAKAKGHCLFSLCHSRNRKHDQRFTIGWRATKA